MARPDFIVGEPTPIDDGHRVSVDVPADLRWVEGHFDDDPIVPGVAQLLLAERIARKVWPDLGPPTGIRRLKFVARIDPGDALTVTVGRDAGKVKFMIHRGDEECTRGSLTFR